MKPRFFQDLIGALTLSLVWFAPTGIAQDTADSYPKKQIRLILPAGNNAETTGLTPGMFARVWLPATGSSAQADAEKLYLPSTAILRRAEMTGVYVLDAQGQPRLRQVRLGRTAGELVEVLSGVRKGEQVAADPKTVNAL